MSGPKVVRIKTREEFEAEARSQLGDVEAAFRRLERIARRFDAWSEERRSALVGRRALLEGMFAAQRWNDLASAARAECDFLEREASGLEAEATRARAAMEIRRRRVRDAARGLVRQLERAGTDVPAELRGADRALLRATDAEVAVLEQRVRGHLGPLASLSDAALSTEANALAARLRDENGGAGRPEDPLQTASPAPAGPASRLVALLAELEVAAPDAVTRCRERLAEAEGEEDPARRALLIDSFQVELSRELAAQRMWHSTRARAEALVVSLEGEGDDGAAPAKRVIEAAIAGRDTRALEAATRRAERYLRALAGQRAAAARRGAVLAALAALGYEVREGMETALAQGGRVVIRKPATPDYGVEVAAVAESPRYQVRVVGSPSPDRTAERDCDAEQRWCGEVELLRSALHAEGSEFDIERAQAPGATPVKTVEFAPTAQDRTTRLQPPQGRRRSRDA